MRSWRCFRLILQPRGQYSEPRCLHWRKEESSSLMLNVTTATLWLVSAYFVCLYVTISLVFTLRCPPPLPNLSYTHPNRHETPRGPVPLWATPATLCAWVSKRGYHTIWQSENFKWFQIWANTTGRSRLKWSCSPTDTAAASPFLFEQGGKQPLFLSFGNKHIKARQDTQSKRQRRATLARHNRLLTFPLLTQKQGAQPK